MKLGIIGYGELGSQMLLHLSQKEKHSEAFLFDDYALKKKISNSYPFNNFSDTRFSDVDFYVGLGYKNLSKKMEVILELEKLKRNMPAFIHASSFVNPTVVIHQSVFAYPMCNFDKNVVLHAGTLLNNSVTISHDSVIGSCTYISPGVIISGFVTIGECCFIGSGSVISNNIKIGDNVTIGAGSLITKDVPNNSFVIGNPMKFLKQPLKLT